MDKRIFGLAGEYGFACVFRGQQRLSADEVARDVFRGVVPGAVVAGEVPLRNGARLQLEVASQPEYATPECDNVLDLIAYDKAGERILEELGVDAQRRLRDAGITADVYLFKTSTGVAGNSPGCRENYQLGRAGEFGRLADMLIPFLVTRQLICGAGRVVQTPQGAVYSLSQGPGRGWRGVSPAGIRSRPLIGTRSEPPAGASRAGASRAGASRAGGRAFRRLHVAVSDPNMSETTVLLKLGATALVLAMIEAGAVPPDLVLDNPVGAIGAVSLDITGRTPVRLADGRELSALDIQREYLTRARDFADLSGADAMSGRVLGTWERVLDSIEAGSLDAIAREIDWVTKYQLIERYRAAHGLPLSAPQIAQLDLAYHDVNRGRSGYYLLQRDGAVERVVRDLDIFEAKTIPPASGRYRQAG